MTVGTPNEIRQLRDWRHNLLLETIAPGPMVTLVGWSDWTTACRAGRGPGFFAAHLEASRVPLKAGNALMHG